MVSEPLLILPAGLPLAQPPLALLGRGSLYPGSADILAKCCLLISFIFVLMPSIFFAKNSKEPPRTEERSVAVSNFFVNSPKEVLTVGSMLNSESVAPSV